MGNTQHTPELRVEVPAVGNLTKRVAIVTGKDFYTAGRGHTLNFRTVAWIGCDDNQLCGNRDNAKDLEEANHIVRAYNAHEEVTSLTKKALEEVSSGNPGKAETFLQMALSKLEGRS